jgi:hypothetical protein
MQRLLVLVENLEDGEEAKQNAPQAGPLFYENLLYRQAKRIQQLSQLLTLGDFNKAVFSKTGGSKRPKDDTQCRRLINEVAEGMEVSSSFWKS